MYIEKNTDEFSSPKISKTKQIDETSEAGSPQAISPQRTRESRSLNKPDCYGKWLTVDDVCSIYSVTRKTVYNWTCAGKLVAKKIKGNKRGRSYFDALSVERLMGE